MKEAIQEARKKIEVLHAEIRNLEGFITAAQKVCEHDWVDDYFDYHNRIDHEKCSICGLKR